MKPEIEGESKKDCLFQFALANALTCIIEDTNLITRKEADELWDKHYPRFVRCLQEGKEPEMAIWINCDTDTDYHTTSKYLDYRDNLEVKDGKVYKITREEV